MPLSVMWPFTQAWYGDRLDPDYQPRSVDQLRQILADVGLTTPFWQL